MAFLFPDVLHGDIFTALLYVDLEYSDIDQLICICKCQPLEFVL